MEATNTLQLYTSEKINEIAEIIIKASDPDKLILFGSYANGNPTVDSDLDFLVIKESTLPRMQRSYETRMALIGSQVPLDILFYTPSEFDLEANSPYSFLKSAIPTSKVLYERKP
ncbi:nucleotidyltransferase domain-containing protein [Parasediminibacterium sp. JCM 36343]|uniref:nucleotidyltransferase domain-containing protein n=1 Tax=Parasediminibacterium sp. JCM 36343 TaxID=3374279 RepID=UPI00397D55F8